MQHFTNTNQSMKANCSDKLMRWKNKYLDEYLQWFDYISGEINSALKLNTKNLSKHSRKSTNKFIYSENKRPIGHRNWKYECDSVLCRRVCMEIRALCLTCKARLKKSNWMWAHRATLNTLNMLSIHSLSHHYIYSRTNHRSFLFWATERAMVILSILSRLLSKLVRSHSLSLYPHRSHNRYFLDVYFNVCASSMSKNIWYWVQCAKYRVYATGAFVCKSLYNKSSFERWIASCNSEEKCIGIGQKRNFSNKTGKWFSRNECMARFECFLIINSFEQRKKNCHWNRCEKVNVLLSDWMVLNCCAEFNKL